MQLDHYLEVLRIKPGALPGSTVAQARDAGVFTATHDAFWAAARKTDGDADTTRAPIDVLPTEQDAGAAVDQACRRLRLPTIRAARDEALTVPGKEQLSYQGFQAELLLAECDDRDGDRPLDGSKPRTSRGTNGWAILISTRIQTSTQLRSIQWLAPLVPQGRSRPLFLCPFSAG